VVAVANTMIAKWDLLGDTVDDVAVLEIGTYDTTGVGVEPDRIDDGGYCHGAKRY